jgi:hypothetical protein
MCSRWGARRVPPRASSHVPTAMPRTAALLRDCGRDSPRERGARRRQSRGSGCGACGRPGSGPARSPDALGAGRCGDGGGGRTGGGAARSGRRDQRTAPPAERHPGRPHARAAGGHRHHLRGAAECHRRRGGLCLKSGNASILRGGSEAIHCNQAIAALVHEGLASAGLPGSVVQVIATTDRAVVGHLIRMREFVDVIVPRGGKGLVARLLAEARVPMIQHLDGNCHVYVDDDADPEQALRIVENAKTQRYGTCNTAESLLLARSVVGRLLPPVAAMLTRKGVEIRGCPETMAPHQRGEGGKRGGLRQRVPGADHLGQGGRRHRRRRSSTSITTARIIPTPSSPRITARRCASCAKSIRLR